MSRGITLLATGASGTYSKWAINMAISIKYHSPGIQINIVVDEKNNKQLQGYERELFNEVIPINPSHLIDEFGNSSPGKAKLYINEYARFGKNMYLDVDGICIREIDSLFAMLNKDVQLQCTGKFNEKSKEWQCSWMTLAGVRFNYELPDAFDIYECNSSFIYFEKGKKSDEFFRNAQNNFINNWNNKIWGNAFPDELAFNVATAQTKIDPTIRNDHEKLYKNHFPVCFNVKDLGGLRETEKQVYFIGLYGGNKPQFTMSYQAYDGLSMKYNREIMGRQNPYKSHILMGRKHVSTTQAVKQKEPLIRAKIKEIADQRKGIFSIDDTIKIELLPSELKDGECFNGSVVKFKEKTLVAFRKDRKPYGKSSRIFICELENWKQVSPAKEIIGLQATPGKGFEDPRLFIYDGLCMVYNDNKTQYFVRLNDDLKVIECSEIQLPKLPNVGDGRKKNISPFTNGELKYIYSASGDHTVTNNEKAFIGTGKNIDYGIIRGGSPAVKIGEEFYTCFHSCLNFKGFQHYRQYCAGVYSFDENYNVTGVSKPLLIAPYTEDMKRMYANVFVVFPVGLYEDNGEVIISFGYQDNQIRVLKLKTNEFKKLCAQE